MRGKLDDRNIREIGKKDISYKGRTTKLVRRFFDFLRVMGYDGGVGIFK